MREEIKFSESAGRTIEAVRYARWFAKAVVTFTDGTFACIGCEGELDGGDGRLGNDEFNRHGFDDKVLDEIGVMSIAEIEAEKQAEHEIAMQRHLEADRRRYLQLKAQFER